MIAVEIKKASCPHGWDANKIIRKMKSKRQTVLTDGFASQSLT
jgi:hypothetical protein